MGQQNHINIKCTIVVKEYSRVPYSLDTLPSHPPITHFFFNTDLLSPLPLTSVASSISLSFIPSLPVFDVEDFAHPSSILLYILLTLYVVKGCSSNETRGRDRETKKQAVGQTDIQRVTFV